MNQETDPGANGSNLTAADVATLAKRRQLPAFAVILDGSALAPQYHHGDLLVVDTRLPAHAGTAVLVEAPIDSGQTKAMLMNADRDLLDLRGGYIPQGAYTLLGVVTERIGIEEQTGSLVR